MITFIRKITRALILVTTIILLGFTSTQGTNNRVVYQFNNATTFDNDIALDSVTSPLNLACEGVWPIQIKMTNAGNTIAITSVTINWSMNSVPQTPFNWTGILAVGASTYVTLNNSFLFNPGNYVINVVLTSPNNQADPFTDNNYQTVFIQIKPKPSIYIQPYDQSINVGENAMFSTIGAGANLTYQWQLSTNGGLNFSNLVNLPPYSNVTTPGMDITGATQFMNGFLYRCIISGSCQPPTLTDTVMLSVGPAVKVIAGQAYACTNASADVPIILKDAANVQAMKLTLLFSQGNIIYNSATYLNPLLSNNGAFIVTPAPGEITIQWTGLYPVNLSNDTICKLNFQYISNTTLIFDTIMPGNCQISSPDGTPLPSHFVNGALTSASPSILYQPDNKLIIMGQTGFFRVLADGSPSYQWQLSLNGDTTWSNLVNNVMYTGVTMDTLWVNPTISMNGYRFRCVMDACGTIVYSNPAVMSVMKILKTWIDTNYSCTCYTPALEILVPIKVANFDSVNSISLSLIFKNTALQYNGYQNVNPAIQFPLACVSNIGGNKTMFRFASFATTGYMTIPDNGILVNLKFKVLCDSTKLQWETWTPGACEYSIGPDTAIYVYNAEFINGYVMDGGPVITSDPMNQTVIEGSTASFSCSGTTHNSPLTYQWQLSTDGGSIYTDIINNSGYSGAQTNSLLVQVSSVTMDAYKYRCKLNGLCDQQTTSAALLTVNPDTSVNLSSIHGMITYFNTTATPMNASFAQLKQNGQIINQDTTNAFGEYLFENLVNGTYLLEVSTTKPWGGVNAADGLLILKHFTGLSTLNGLKLKAADLDASGYVNATDALTALKRFVGLTNSFIAGDWAFENDTITISGISDITRDLKALCYGDVDASYTPAAKTEPTVTLENQGTLDIMDNMDISIPLKVTENIEVGSVSLVMDIPADNFRVHDVDCSQEGKLVFRQEGRKLKIAWINLQPMQLKAGDVLMILKGNFQKPLNPGCCLWGVDPESQLTDANAIEYNHVGLAMPEIRYSDHEFFLGQNTPNPFANTTEFSYYLPERSEVKLVISDLLGRTLKMIVNTTQDIGNHNLTLDLNNLYPGIYTYTIHAKGISKDYHKTMRMMVGR